MAAGYPCGYPRGSNATATNPLFKRSLSELDRQQQHHHLQIQNALFLRSVKQRLPTTPQPHQYSPVSPLSPLDLSSSSSSASTNSNFLRSQQQRQSIIKTSSDLCGQLQELEKHLLDDDDDDQDCVGITASSEWSGEIQKLLSSSPTTSSSSSSSSSSSPISPKQLLLDTAAAISEGNLEIAASNLAVLKQSADPRGDPDKKLIAMMASALSPLVNSVPPMMALAELSGPEQRTATQMLYNVSPCFQLALMAANFAILDASRGYTKVHIVDFDLVQGGGQYASLINVIAERSRRQGTHPVVKITAVCDPTFPFNTVSTVDNIKVVADKLTGIADRSGVIVRFNIMNREATELSRLALCYEPGEALVFNFAFVLSRIADESVSPANPRDQLLRQVKSLEPTIVTVVEQELNANTTPFMTRFNEAKNYYGSVLESLDGTMKHRWDSNRIRVELGLARKAANCIACEGADRVERPEVWGKWRARMGMAGLCSVPLGPASVEPAKALLGSMRASPGFSYREHAERVGFGWMGRELTVASAWR